MPDAIYILLRLTHILGAMVWVGFGLFIPLFLGPSVADAGPDGGKVVAAMQKRGLMTFLPLVALATILSGLALYWRLGGGALGAFMMSRVGMAFALGGLAAIVAYAVGVTVTRPSMLGAGKAMESAAKAGTPGEREQHMANAGRLRARGAAAARVVATLILAAAALMILARFA